MTKVNDSDGNSFGDTLDELGNNFIASGKAAQVVGAGLFLVDGPLPFGDFLGVPTFFAGGSLGALGVLFQFGGEVIGNFEEQTCDCPPTSPPPEADMPDLNSIELQEMFDPDDLFGEGPPQPDFGLDGVPLTHDTQGGRIGGATGGHEVANRIAFEGGGGAAPLPRKENELLSKEDAKQFTQPLQELGAIFKEFGEDAKIRA